MEEHKRGEKLVRQKIQTEESSTRTEGYVKSEWTEEGEAVTKKPWNTELWNNNLSKYREYDPKWQVLYLEEGLEKERRTLHDYHMDDLQLLYAARDT